MAASTRQDMAAGFGTGTGIPVAVLEEPAHMLFAIVALSIAAIDAPAPAATWDAYLASSRFRSTVDGYHVGFEKTDALWTLVVVSPSGGAKYVGVPPQPAGRSSTSWSDDSVALFEATPPPDPIVNGFVTQTHIEVTTHIDIPVQPVVAADALYFVVGDVSFRGDRSQTYLVRFRPATASMQSFPIDDRETLPVGGLRFDAASRSVVISIRNRPDRAVSIR